MYFSLSIFGLLCYFCFCWSFIIILWGKERKVSFFGVLLLFCIAEFVHKKDWFLQIL